MFRSKYILQTLAIGVLIFGGGNFAAAQKTVADKNALAKFEKGIEQGNYQAIERDLLNYAISNPNDARAFKMLGDLRFAQNRLSEAKSLYQKTLSLDAHSAAARINLAVINFQTGNLDSAISALNEIDERDISGDALRLNLANAFALVGDCRKAQSYVEKLAPKIKNVDALPLRAGCFLQSGEREKAVSLIAAAKGAARQNPATAIKFARVLSDAAMNREAADVLRSLIAVAPNNADALILLAQTEIAAKDLANAEIHLERAAKINPAAADLFFVRSLLESEKGNYSQSLDSLEKSLAANPNQAKVLSQLVITAMRANQAGKAVKTAEKLLQLKPDEPEFLYLHGAASLQNNNLPAAENSLKRFVELRPKDARGCLALGLTFAAQADKTEIARGQLQRCIEKNPQDYEAKYQLGLSYKTQGETAKAIEYFEETVRTAPDYALALRDLGAIYLQTGAEAKARIVLEKAAAISPNDADTHFQLGRLYNLAGETELAKKHLEIFRKLKNPVKSGT